MDFNWKKLNFPESNKLESVKKYVLDLKLRTDPENYVLTNDIDFTDLNFNTEVVFNRLETLGENEYHTLSGMNYTYNVSGNKKAIISLIASSISNVIFKDVSITTEQTSNNSYVNIIVYISKRFS